MAGIEFPSDGLEDAYGALADETRLRILRALWAADETPMSFSELRESAGVRDSGQFNYHLDTLTGRFVRKRDSGYELTHAGTRVIGAAVSGTYSETDVSVDSIAVGDCPDCDDRLLATYERGYVRVECDDCDLVVTEQLPAPPVLAAEHEPETLPAVLTRLLLTRAQTINRGFCLLCGGSTARSIAADDRSAGDDGSEHLRVTVDCRSCGWRSSQVAGVVVLDHPAVSSFLFEHGVDLRDTPIWEFDWLSDPHATVTNDDPLRVDVAVTLDDDRLILTLDERASVVEYRRESGASP